MSTQETPTVENAPQDSPHSPPRPNNSARASREAKRELLKQAERVAGLAAASHGPGSPEVRQQARQLLNAAVAWQESAIKATLDAGEQPRTRPTFQHGPKPPNLEAQPGARKYHSRLFFWASRYAWDKHDGLDAREAARNLVLTAYMGYHKKVEESTQARS